jgi:hypothetical protein
MLRAGSFATRTQLEKAVYNATQYGTLDDSIDLNDLDLVSTAHFGDGARRARALAKALLWRGVDNESRVFPVKRRAFHRYVPFRELPAGAHPRVTA